MPERHSLCVFCGSMRGRNPQHVESARRVGTAMAKAGLGLVYGGGKVGLMGVVADAVLAEGGPVVGVIPEALSRKEVAHEGLTELHVVAGMHERKSLMAQRSAGFLTLPGGIGTFEEFFEILSWATLGLHGKPLGILNVGGYYDPLLALLEHARGEGFVRPAHLELLRVSDDPETLVRDLLNAPIQPVGPMWIDSSET